MDRKTGIEKDILYLTVPEFWCMCTVVLQDVAEGTEDPLFPSAICGSTVVSNKKFNI